MNRKLPDPEDFEASVADMPPFGRAGCPPIRLLRAASQEALPDQLQSRVSAHVLTCSSCRTLQADLQSHPVQPEASPQQVDQILARVRREGAAASRSRGWIFSWRTTAVAAGLALCAIVVFWQLRIQTPQPDQVRPSAVIQQPVPAPQIPDVLKIEKPAVKLTLTVLTWRSGSNTQEQFLQDIAPALDLYRGDRFAEAATRLETLSSKYQNSVEVFFYLGVSRLMLGDYAAACAALEKARRIGDDSFSSDISWYLALGYQRLGREPEARALFSELCSPGNDYRDKACAALK